MTNFRSTGHGRQSGLTRSKRYTVSQVLRYDQNTLDDNNTVLFYPPYICMAEY